VDEGLRAFLRRCGADEGHADRVTSHALAIFEGVARVAQLDAAAREVLRGAAMLHDVGQFVGYPRHHKHTYYLVANAELPGYSDRERELVANVARYHRRSMPRPRHPAFMALTAAEQELVRKLAVILRVADALDRSRRAMVGKLEVRADDREVRLVARVQGEAELERWAVEEKAAPLFEETLGLRLRLEIKEGPPPSQTQQSTRAA
jgi:exopolyphosphatase/guanosine-5'-triphosphate,3'-diphosphate pyrophosphatase